MKRAIAFVALASVVCAVAWLVTGGVQPPAAGVAPSPSSAGVPPATARSTSVSIQPQSQPLVLPNPDPFATLALKWSLPPPMKGLDTTDRLRKLARAPNIHEAQLEALRSEDPLLFVHAFHLNGTCFQTALFSEAQRAPQARESTRSASKSVKSSQVEADEQRFFELRAYGGPMRLFAPKPVRDEFPELTRSIEESLQVAAAEASGGRKRDYARETRLWFALQAPISEIERSAFESTREEVAKSCGESLFGRNFGAQYRATREALAARGVLSALIFNESAGWTSSRHLGALSDRDYALVEKGVLEQHPDVLALLLLRGSLATQFDLARIPEDALGVVGAIGSVQASWLAACTLGVADCSPTGSEFRTMCLMLGGCDQPDLAALWRAVLTRDGLEPSVFDRAAARLVDAIREGDLARLGIQRAKKTG